mmetsp:Transcript_98730/g.156092  ORF Transcript_98730/g.156092 Transcript_98730/m.156092 type:complete len:136 (+) Transcript_98730:45-452(+)
MFRISFAFACIACTFRSSYTIETTKRHSQDTSLAMLLLSMHPGSQHRRSRMHAVVSHPEMIERGSTVLINRPESYWHKTTGTVAAVSKGDDRYPATVRFEKANFQGITTNNYALDELTEVAPPKAKGKAKAKAKA